MSDKLMIFGKRVLGMNKPKPSTKKKSIHAMTDEECVACLVGMADKGLARRNPNLLKIAQEYDKHQTLSKKSMLLLRILLPQDTSGFVQQFASSPKKKLDGTKRKRKKPLSGFPNNLPPLEVEGLKGGTLLEYQKQGVAFIQHMGGNCIVGDEMGLGKTVQAIAYLHHNENLRPALVVCPNCMKGVWQRELRKWTDKGIAVMLSGTPRYPLPKGGNRIYVINYEILHKWEKMLMDADLDVLIMDEVHLIKNPDTKRSKAMANIAAKTPHKMALSGTPVLNKPYDVYWACHLIKPNLFPSKMQFIIRYCGGERKGGDWSTSGSSNTKELHEILTQNIMIRRKKSEVMKELPPVSHFVIPMDILNRKKYNQDMKATKDYVKSLVAQRGYSQQTQMASMARVEKLKQLCLQGKMEYCMDWIDDFLEGGEKIILFCMHTITVDMLMKRYGDLAVRIDGKITSQKKRMDAIDRFQTDPSCKVFVGNIMAASAGITLTASSTVAFLELPWRPADVQQAVARAHRMTQVNSVFAYYLLAKDTIEEKIMEKLAVKEKIINDIVDGGGGDGGDVFNDLFKEMLK